MSKEIQPIDMVTDVYVPAAIIVLLFVINGIILFLIFQKRKYVVYEDIVDDAPNSSNTQQHGEDTSTIELGSL
uniref:Uncharacterized protein n=1 Tax=Haematobia irritans TaxID=7368 RepID=A0A1L8E7B1_HAEIR